MTSASLKDAVRYGLWLTVADHLAQGVSDAEHRSVVEAASKQADDFSLCWRVLPFCTADERQHVCSLAISRGLWRTVRECLKQGVSDNERIRAFEEAIERADDRTLGWQLVPLSTADEREIVLTKALERGLWRTVGECLKLGVSHATRRLAIDHAFDHAEQFYFCWQVLRHCTAYERKHVLRKATRRGMMMIVGKCFKYGNITDAQRRWAFQEAIRAAGCRRFEPKRSDRSRLKRGGILEFMIYIVPNCSTDEREDVLVAAVERGLWEIVGKCLSRGVSKNRRRWALEEASKRAGESDLKNYILFSVSYTDTVQEGVCLTVYEFLMHRLLSFNRHHAILAEEFSSKLFERPLCTLAERGDIAKEAARRGLWEIVSICLTTGISQTQRSSRLEDAAKQASVIGLNRFLPLLTSDELALFLTETMKRDEWSVVSKCLGRFASEDQQSWALEEIMKQTDDDNFIRQCVYICNASTLDMVLDGAVRRGLWQTVAACLTEGVSETQHRWAVEEASRRARSEDILTILPLCTALEREFVLAEVVKRGLWECVHMCLTRGVSETQHRLAVVEASKRADDEDFSEYIFSECTEEELSVVLPEINRRGLNRWAMWRTTFYDNNSNQNFDASTIAMRDDFSLRKHVLPQCSLDERTVVLTEAIGRGLWRTVAACLKRGVGEIERATAIEEARSRAPVDELGHVLQICTAEELEFVLSIAVAEGQWPRVGECLKRVVGEKTRKWAIEEASKHAASDDLKAILPFCTAGEREYLLTEAIRQDFWSLVGDCLEHGVSDVLHDLTVPEAVKRAGREEINRIISVPREPYGRLNKAVSKDQWWFVYKYLKQAVDSSQHRQAVEEAAKRADDGNLRRLVSVCSADMPETVLPQAVRRGLWWTVAECLKRRVSEAQRTWALQMAIDSAEDGLFSAVILPVCTANERQFVLKAAVQRGSWWTVGECLRRGVSDADYSMAIDEATLQADGELGEHILLCLADERESVLKSSVKRGLWQIAGKCLRRGISEELRGQTVKAALEHGQDSACMCSILPYCTTTERHAVFPKLVQQGLWDAVSLALQLGVVASEREYAVREASLRSDDCETTIEILRYCSDEHCQSGFDTCVKRGLWRAAASMIHRGITDRQCAEAITKASRCSQDALSALMMQMSGSQISASYLICDDRDARTAVCHCIRVNKAFENETLDAFLRLYGTCYAEILRYKRGSLLQDQTDADFRDIVSFNAAFLSNTLAQLELVSQDLHVTFLREQLRIVLNQFRDHCGNSACDMTLHDAVFDRLMLYVTHFTPTCDENLLRDCVIIPTLAAQTVNQTVQGAALNLLPASWEEVRRLVFATAVKCGDWTFVNMLADRSFYDDQCALTLSDALHTRELERSVDLERHVGTELSRKILPELIARKQWSLVAVVMETCLDDRERRQVIEIAMSEREGTVVSRGIDSMDENLSPEEREDLFQRALNAGMWQVLKRLAEEKDDTGIIHRDTILPRAVASHQWNTVTHCQSHGADIDRPDTEGNTLLHRAARKGDWDTVEGLIYHDADQRLVDCDEYTVLHRAAADKRWDTVKLLVQFHGDINQGDPDGRTPLSRLIENKQADIIEHSLLWGRDKGFRPTCRGKTALHVVCEGGLWDAIRSVAGRGVDPVACTDSDKSALYYAVRACQNNQKTVAECLRMGVSTYEPPIGVYSTLSSRKRYCPFGLALMNGEVVLMRMLYESGACPNKQLYALTHEIFNMREREQYRSEHFIIYEPKAPEISEEAGKYLDMVVATPRRLKSQCRLVISHSLGVSKPRTRERKVKALPLPSMLKDYVKFADITDPNFGHQN